ncbi:hypothetical protein MRB53_006572 [Persea americana]|uniref:Uncharacterized protein n=1 Tax=Persea americana TaxID=3435 RepID=A0ACC2MGS8_PERAE|nr:hypothetical protein MRB53_006572 [Persea americana]
MDLYGKKTLWSFMDEEQRNITQSPTNLSFKAHPMTPILENDPQMSPARPSSASMISLTPSTPDSPWTLSPLHPTPSPPLFYHCLASLHRHDGNVFSIAISKGLVFTGSESHRIRLWRQPDCTERGHISASSSEVRAMLATGSTLFTTHKDRKIRIWSVSLSDHLKYRKVTTLPEKKAPLISFSKAQPRQKHKDTISCIAYYHAEGLLYTGSWDKTVKVWSLSEKKCVDSFVAHDDYINSIVVNQEDGFLFTASSDGSIKIWRRVYGETSHTLTMSLRFQPSPVNALALSSSHSSCFLYSGSSDGFVNYWEKEALSGRYNHSGFLQGHRFAVLCLATIEKLVFSGSEDTTIRVWRRAEASGFHSCLAVVEGHRGPVKCLAACLEMEKVVRGVLVYSASLDRMVKVWRIKMFGEEKSVGMNEAEKMELNKKLLEYETSPVLSPSWVERKLHGLH